MKRLLYLVALCAAFVLALAPAAQAQTDGLSCGDFANQETAQAILDANPHDPYEFDADGDAVACEDAGGGSAEDGTLAPFGQYEQYQYSGGAEPAQLAATGGPPLLWVALAAIALLGAGAVLAAFAVARRAPHLAAIAGMHRAFAHVGDNGKRLAVVALAAALATLLAVVLGSGVLGTADRAEAQGGANPLYLTTAVYPRPASAVPVGTRMDFLITEQNVTAGGRSARNVTVYEQLPAGVTYVSARSSQGTCAPMADQPVINCSVGTIPPGGVVHINVVAVATTRGSHTNYVYDSLGNTASAGFTIVRPLMQ